MNKKVIKQSVKEDFIIDKKTKQLKEGKKKYKEVVASSIKENKKENKFRYKYYKRLKNKPIRLLIDTIVFMLFVVLIISVLPIINDIRGLLSLEINSNTPEAQESRLQGEILAEAISDEGIILLQNNQSFLPLKDLKVNVFGYAALGFRHGGAGSGGADQSRSISFFDGLSHAGIMYNEQLYDHYLGQNEEYTSNNDNGFIEIIKGRFGEDITLEPIIDYLTDDIIEDAKAYSETAIIVLSNGSTESADISIESLKLEKNQKDLIEKVASQFENIIIVINSGNPMELGFVEEYPSIKSVLWVGTPGSKGTQSIGKILVGEVNPSGRLTDTYVYDLNTHPSTVTYGDHRYENIEGMAFINYNEGIYVGYRFFETYYADNEEAYGDVVQYPFGYGLSYTEFKWEIVDEIVDDTINISVEVINTGDTSGKDVVQVYVSAPYYPGGIEKSEVELIGYGKTSLLEPGESEIVTISFYTKDMSSYDMNNEEAYVLEAGQYDIRISKNVHDVVEIINYKVEETIVYHEDEKTGVPYENQFDYAMGNITYLSRNDWEGTYPKVEDMSFEAAVATIDGYFERVETTSGVEPDTEVDHGIVLSDLKGLDYDDSKWDNYIEQFSVKEMIDIFVKGAWRTVGVERLGLPSTILLDGPAGINFFFGDVTSASYPTEIVIASTWNDELAYLMGESVGAEAVALGIDGWYAPAMNIHRLPNSGRNFEYYSEDPLLSGRMAANMTKGAQSHNVMVFIKHFALNDQEINARKGIMIWANEQAIREIYLKPFEIAIKEGEATAVMSSFSHIGYKWAGGNHELLENVLRGEWGFIGLVSSDAVQAGFMNPELSLRNGNDLMLNPLTKSHLKQITALYEEDPVGVIIDLQKRMHNIMYSILNYTTAVD